MFSTKTLARIAGVLYLIVGAGGGFSEYVRSSVTVPGDAAATAANIVQHGTLFQVGFITDLVDFTCFLGVGLLMYAILKPINAQVAVAMVVINAVSVAIQAINMLNQIGALMVATQPGYTAGMSAATSHGLVLLFMNLHQQGYVIAQIFFGLFLLPLGLLVYRSGYFPRALGVILMLGCGGYLAGVAATYLFGFGVAVYFGLSGGLAEIAFLLWLLIMGAKTEPSTAVKGELAWKA